MDTLKNAVLTGFAFLSSNRVPPNTSLEDINRLKKINHMESKKFYIVLTSVLILAFFYFSSVAIMFLLPKEAPEVITGFVTVFSKTIEILSIIIATYVGAQAAVDLKYGSSSNVSAESLSSVERVETVTFIDTNAKEEDYELA